ncbi:MAG TPA: c-type cytochrome [Bacteroidales bacterium]|nr:c-type cytochrome [Bacteroidales bacterium]
MKKVLLALLAVIVIVVAGAFVFVSIKWKKPFEAPYPELKASTDPALIARGAHLAYGPAHCIDCHATPGTGQSFKRGAIVPLTGGLEFVIDPGTFRTPNLTPDKETGIGDLTDAQITRAMRYSVKHDGSYMVPFMPFQNLSDEDVVAILSFLRSQEPVKHKVQPSEFTFLGKALLAFGALKPEGPVGTPTKSVVPDTTAEYGSYLAHSVANCFGCHTNRDLKAGKFTGEPFAGGFKFDDAMTRGYVFKTPNLTPDKETGIMTAWDKTTFINRMHNGRVYETSPMPWEAFARMDDTELKALYAYLHSLTPVRNDVGKIVLPPE